MKKISYLLVLLAVLSLGLMTNCKDDDNGGIIPPIDTTLLDHVLEYPVDLTMSETAYDNGTKVEIDFDQIATWFGITKEDLLAGIADSADAPDITLYGIGAAYNADAVLGTAKNTNGIWGHWWGATGANTEWASTTDSAMVYAEYNGGTTYFIMGQYPKRLRDGMVINFYECLKYNDIRVGCHFTVTAKKAAEIVATVVNTQKLNIEVLEKTNYDLDSVQFDLAQTISDIGVTSMENVTRIAVKEDGSYAQETNADNGYWIGRNGYVSGWGAGGVVYTDYKLASGSSYIGIGQFPDSLSAGEEFTIKFGFLANSKIEMLEITIKVAGYVDPETPPTGDPADATIDVAFNQAFNTAYTSVQYDVKETLRNAFKMTTYQIHKAILNGDLKLWIAAVADSTPKYSADAPGYWIDSVGGYTTWGVNSKIWCSLGHSETELYLYAGNHPEDAKTGDVIKPTLIAVLNGTKVTFNVTYTVE
jgi:hypothetical protein